MKTINKIDAEALVQEILELYPKLSKENQIKFHAMLEKAYQEEMAERHRENMDA